MTEPKDKPPADGPPVFLPEPPREPPRRPGEVPPASLPGRGAPPDPNAQPGRGIRIDPPEEGLKTQGIPTWMIFAGLVGTLFLSAESSSPIPFIVGVLFFILLRRPKRR